MFRLNMYLMCMDCLGIKIFLYKDFNKFIKIAKTNSGWEKYIKDFLENQPSLIIKEQGKKLAIANSWDQKIRL